MFLPDWSFPIAQLTVVPRVWYAVPLIVAISLVYGATRHEQAREILIHAGKSIGWIMVFLVVIMAIVWFGGYWN